MRFSWKRRRLAIAAALSILAVISSAGVASAALPGEENAVHLEYAGGNPVSLRGTMCEARSVNGHLFQVWRGATNNIIWMSLDNGTPFDLGFTATYVSPVVAPYGTDSFMVVQTGTDRNIYYTIVTPGSAGNVAWTGWTEVPGQATGDSVSIAQGGEGSSFIYMVYRSSTDDRIFGLAYEFDSWGSAQVISGGLSPSSPSVTYNPLNGRLFVAAQGEDDSVWTANSWDGGHTWSGWTSLGQSDSPDTTSPSIAAAGDGNMVVSYAAQNENAYNRLLSQWAAPNGSWSRDLSGVHTASRLQNINNPNNDTINMLMNLDGGAYWKQNANI